MCLHGWLCHARKYLCKKFDQFGKLPQLRTVCLAPKVWHGEADIATYDFIGGYREWHGGRDAMFDNGYSNREMYHSTTCDEDRGVVITFKEPVEYIDVKIFTRSYCCRDPRYNGVCLYADGNKIACTPSDLGDPGLTINFKDYNMLTKPTVAREYAIMWDQKGTSCAQIEELFFHYYGMILNLKILI